MVRRGDGTHALGANRGVSQYGHTASVRRVRENPPMQTGVRQNRPYLRHPRHQQPSGWPLLAFGTLLVLTGCATSSTSAGSRPAKVLVATGKAAYTASEAISVTVTNGLAMRIWTPDHQSGCTVVSVQRQDGQSWQTLHPCLLKSATRLIPIDPGHTLTLHVQPPTASGVSRWPLGTYRVAFTYQRTQADPGTTIYSAVFVISV